MSSKKKQKESADPDDLFMDQLTKDEKEAMLNRKMEEIRRKNQQLQKRHELILADKKAAEEQGIAVSLKPPPLPEGEEDAQKSPPRMRGGGDQQEPSPAKMRGVRVAVAPEVEKKSAFATGRGRRLANMKNDAAKSQERERKSNNRKPRPKSQCFEEKRDERSEKPKRPLSQGFEMPPDVTSSSFLYDESRQGPLPDNVRNKSARNRANFGGTDFANVKSVMHQEKQRGQAIDHSNRQMLEITMTGKERRDYVQWKQERDRIDAERLHRAQREGAWKREWDTDKKIEDPVPPPSRRLEPGRRPAGRIGSGRFTLGEERKNADIPPPAKSGPRTAGTNRTSGRLPAHHDDEPLPQQQVDMRDSRHVNQQNDSLVIEVVNDLTGSGLDGRGRGRGGFRGRGRGDRGAQGGRGGFRGRGSDFREERQYADSRGERDYNNRNVGGDRDFRDKRFYSDFRDANKSERNFIDTQDFRDNREYNRDFREYRDFGERGGYRGRGGDRGRGFRGAARGSERGKPGRPKKGWAEWEAEQAEREAARAGRGRRGRGGSAGPHSPIDAEILGRAIIVTTSERAERDGVAELPPSPSVPGRRGDKYSPNKLSGQSGDSWETTGTEESWETVEGDDAELEEDVEGYDNEGEMEDEYAEDDYWDDGLQLHDQAPAELPQELNSDAEPYIKPEDTDDLVDEHQEEGDEADIHNSSAESLERFIQEHTLHLNVSTGNLESAPQDEGPNETSTPAVTPLTPLKTPEGVEHVLNWASDVSFEDSQKKPTDDELSASLEESATSDSNPAKSPKSVRFQENRTSEEHEQMNEPKADGTDLQASELEDPEINEREQGSSSCGNQSGISDDSQSDRSCVSPSDKSCGGEVEKPCGSDTCENQGDISSRTAAETVRETLSKQGDASDSALATIVNGTSDSNKSEFGPDSSNAAVVDATSCSAPTTAGVLPGSDLPASEAEISALKQEASSNVDRCDETSLNSEIDSKIGSDDRAVCKASS